MNDTVNKSRRGVIKAGLMLATAGAAVAGTARAQDQKIEQSLVQYQQTPKDGAECDKCVNWAPPNACKIVAGTINPKGWCVAYAPAGG
jgi:hypothetical protein